MSPRERDRETKGMPFLQIAGGNAGPPNIVDKRRQEVLGAIQAVEADPSPLRLPEQELIFAVAAEISVLSRQR